MIALVQRVSRSSVRVGEERIAEIGRGMTVFLGIFKEDSLEDVDKLIRKLPHLRIFADEKGKMNLSLTETGGEALVVSQFTLAGSVKKGRRPGFDAAMPPAEAEKLYEKFCDELSRYVSVQTGSFGAKMEVEILNDGPVTFIVDSRVL